MYLPPRLDDNGVVGDFCRVDCTDRSDLASFDNDNGVVDRLSHGARQDRRTTNHLNVLRPRGSDE